MTALPHCSLTLLMLLVLGPLADQSTAQERPADQRSPAAKNLPEEKSIGKLEVVATLDGPIPTGVTVSQEGRVFINFPRWGDDVPFTVAELRDGKPVPYPNAAVNKPNPQRAAETLISVQSVIVDPADRLWLLDTGRIEFGKPTEGGQKLVRVNLKSNEIDRTITLPPDVALPTTYLNDIRFDLTRGDEGMAFITDSSSSGPNGILVVDLGSGRSWRRLHDHASVKAEASFQPVVEGQTLLNRPEEGKPSFMKVGADGIAMGPKGQRLYYSPLSGRRFYSVSIDALADESLTDERVAATVTNYGDRGFASDGLESDAKGRIYLTNYEDNTIVRFDPNQPLGQRFETIVHDPRALWPDTLAVASDGYLYFTANQLHRQPRFHSGRDLREKPYVVFRTKIDAQPVMLRPSGR